MTYCVAIKVDEGLVFASDSRTSASVDDVRTYCKMHVFEYPGDRLLTLLSAGNLATSQAVLQQIRRDLDNPDAQMSLRLATNLFDAAQYIGSLSVQAQQTIHQQNPKSTVNLETTLILGGQIGEEEPGLFLIYPAGNCISSSPQTPFLQIGEHKYGKPILDRIIRADLRLEAAARCALVSLDSTMRSNLSVGPPLDLLLYRRDELRIGVQQRLDFSSPYYRGLKKSWGEELEAAFTRLPRFEWENDPEQGVTSGPVLVAGNQYQQSQDDTSQQS